MSHAKKTFTKRQGSGKSSLAKVSHHPGAKQGPAKQGPAKKTAIPPTPRDPGLTVGKLAKFKYGSIANIPATIRALVKRQGSGAIVYDPPLETIDAPKDYRIKVSVQAADGFTAAGPLNLDFTIEKADPAFVVAKVADFEYGTIPNIPATIQAAISRKGDGDITFSTPLDKVGAPGKYTIDVTLDPDDYYEGASGQLSFEIRRLPTTLTIKPLKGWEHDPTKLQNLAALIPPLVVTDGDGKIVYDPALATLNDQPGDHQVSIRIEEGPTHQAAGPETLRFSIFLPKSDRAAAFNAWVDRTDAKLVQKVSRKVKFGDYLGEPAPYKPPRLHFATPEDMWESLDKLVGAAVPTKDKVWDALGYPTLKSKADWKLVSQGTTSAGVKMHLTISYDSIRLPRKLTDWNKADAALYADLFEGPPINCRVHMTLESANTESGKVHLYVGGTNGAGRPWARSDFDDQMGEMMDKLSEFRTEIINAIPAAKATLGV